MRTHIDNASNALAEAIVSGLGGKNCFLDKSNILWGFVKGEWVGKRSVWTKDFRACWLEKTESDNVKSWWCQGGESADYEEIFKRTDL